MSFRAVLVVIALILGSSGTALAKGVTTSLLGAPVYVPDFQGKSLQVAAPSELVLPPTLKFLAFLDLTKKKIPSHILVNGFTKPTGRRTSLRSVGTRFLNEDTFASAEFRRTVRPISRAMSDRIAKAGGYKNFSFSPVGTKGLERLVDEDDLQVVVVRYSYEINHNGKRHRMDRPSLTAVAKTRRNHVVFLYFYGAPGAEVTTQSENENFIRWVREFTAAN